MDPLNLSQFTTHIFDSITSLAPVAAVGLVVILLVYGLVFRR
mgnify:CR=1 FL=1